MSQPSLRSRIAELEDTIKLLERHIGRLEKLLDEKPTVKVNTPPMLGTWQFRGFPMVRCHDGCDYPNPWGGTVPPSCRKCGQPEPFPGQRVTITSNGPHDVGGSQ